MLLTKAMSILLCSYLSKNEAVKLSFTLFMFYYDNILVIVTKAAPVLYIVGQ